MYSPRNLIIRLIEQGVITSENIPAALVLAKVQPDTRAWRNFLDRLLLWLGGLALAVSVLFFIAYNWLEMGRIVKFAIVEVCLVTTMFVYWKLDKQKTAAKLALLMGCIFLGVLLALYGQTYQTGADPWQLFFVWAMLMLPWVFVGKFSVLWLLFLVLINTSIVLYFHTLQIGFWIGSAYEEQVFWYVFALNSLALIVWELASRKYNWLRDRWAIRLVVVASLVPISYLIHIAIFNKNDFAVTGLCWLVWITALYFTYRKLIQDLFVLAAVFFSGITVLVALPAKHLLHDWNAGTLLFLAMLTIGLGAGAAIWLKAIHQEFNRAGGGHE